VDRAVSCIRKWMQSSVEVCHLGITDQEDIDDGTATETGVPVALLLGMRLPDGKTGIVYEMAVHPDHRGKGFSDKLSRECWAYENKHHGIEKVEFSIREGVQQLSHRVEPEAASGDKIRYKFVGQERDYPPMAKAGVKPKPLKTIAENGEPLIVAEEPVPTGEIQGRMNKYKEKL